jgi:hypothetical protein
MVSLMLVLVVVVVSHSYRPLSGLLLVCLQLFAWHMRPESSIPSDAVQPISLWRRMKRQNPIRSRHGRSSLDSDGLCPVTVPRRRWRGPFQL